MYDDGISFCQIDPCFSASLLSTISPASTVAGKAVYKAKDMKFENPHTWHIWKAGRLYGWLGTQGGGRVMRQSICSPSLNGGSSRFCASIWHVPSVRAAQCIDKQILISKNGNIDIDIEIDKRVFL